jgi:hypothetical protein
MWCGTRSRCLPRRRWPCSQGGTKSWFWMRLTGKPIAGRFHYHSVIGAVLHLLKQVVFYMLFLIFTIGCCLDLSQEPKTNTRKLIS